MEAARMFMTGLTTEHDRMATYVIGLSGVNGCLRVAEFGWQLSYNG